MIDPQPDVHAAAAAIARKMQEPIGDQRDEALIYATVGLEAARPKMWLRMQNEMEAMRLQIAALEDALASRGSTSSGGMCPHCGNLLSCP